MSVSSPAARTLGYQKKKKANGCYSRLRPFPWIKFKSTPPHPPNHFSIPKFSLLPPLTFLTTSFPLRAYPRSSRLLPSVSSEQQLQLSEDDDDEEEEEEEMDDPSAELSYLDPETDPDSITEWELDFCSRPILDIRGKKLWELVICDDSLSLQYTKYFPNNVINSITLRDAIVSACDSLSLPLPPSP